MLFASVELVLGGTDVGTADVTNPRTGDGAIYRLDAYPGSIN